MLDEESEDSAVRTTERRCKLNVEAPYILKKVCSYIYIYVYKKVRLSCTLILILSLIDLKHLIFSILDLVIFLENNIAVKIFLRELK